MEYQDKEINAKRGDLFVSTSKYSWRGDRFRFRQGSVHGIRKRRWRSGSHYRAFAHMAMRRAYYKALDDGVPLRQKWVEIPDPWDDYQRRDPMDRSWKRYRKTQYKPLTAEQNSVE